MVTFTMNEVEQTRLEIIQHHIGHVQADCLRLAKRLDDNGEFELARLLIANSQIHDNSKYRGIEWLYLHDDIKQEHPDLFQAALICHQQNNPHHPEYWPDGIADMPKVYIAEMVCDWKARSNEFGTDLKDYIKEKATDRYSFTLKGRVYKDIKYFVDLLLDTPFK